MKTIAILCALTLSACVSSSQITPVGKDFLITSTAKGSRNSGKGVIEATQKANAYCASMGKTVVVRHMQTIGSPEWGGENSQFIFGRSTACSAVCPIGGRSTKASPRQ